MSCTDPQVTVHCDAEQCVGVYTEIIVPFGTHLTTPWLNSRLTGRGWTLEPVKNRVEHFCPECSIKRATFIREGKKRKLKKKK